MFQQNKIYIGNLPYSLTEVDLNDLFSKFGALEEVAIIREKESQRSKGYAFIRFAKANHARDSLCLNGTVLKGRTVVVSIAHQNSSSTGRHDRLRSKYTEEGILI